MPIDTIPRQTNASNQDERQHNNPQVGVIERVKGMERIGVTEIRGATFVEDVMLGATAKTDKLDLGEGVASVQNVPEAKGTYGGQDAVGAVIFDGGRIQAMGVAADGVSISERQKSTTAARAVVDTVLREGRGIAGQANLTRDDIQDGVERTLKVSHKRVCRLTGGGQAAAVSFAVSQELSGEKYLYVAYVGDPQLTVFAIDSQGLPKVKRVISPMDIIDKMLRAKGVNVEEFNVRVADQQRAAMMQQYSRNTGIPAEQLEAFFSGAISSTIGDRKEPTVVSFRVNLSQEYAGCSQVTLVGSSDNMGEKVPLEAVTRAYAESRGNNRRMCEVMNELMRRLDQDDGCGVYMDVKL